MCGTIEKPATWQPWLRLAELGKIASVQVDVQMEIKGVYSVENSEYATQEIRGEGTEKGTQKGTLVIFQSHKLINFTAGASLSFWI